MQASKNVYINLKLLINQIHLTYTHLSWSLRSLRRLFDAAYYLNFRLIILLNLLIAFLKISQELLELLFVTLIVIQFLILMAELDPFHLVQLLLFLRELFHPQLGDLVVPFFEALSIVHVKDPLSDFLVDLP